MVGVAPLLMHCNAPVSMLLAHQIFFSWESRAKPSSRYRAWQAELKTGSVSDVTNFYLYLRRRVQEAQLSQRDCATRYVRWNLVFVAQLYELNEQSLILYLRRLKDKKATQNIDKNSSGDEIANVNFFTTISHTYFKIPKTEPTSFNKLDDS